MYKSELADRMGIKHTAMARYMRQVENQLPHYRRTQSLLTPAQVKSYASISASNCRNSQKNLHISKKMSTFAAELVSECQEALAAKIK